MKRFILAALLITVVSAILYSCEEKKPGDITGSVRLKSGQRFYPDRPYYIVLEKDGKEVRNTMLDRDGLYSFDLVEPGSYQMYLRTDDGEVQGTRQDVKVESGESWPVNFTI